jgi:hypothetical protein
MTKIVLYDKEGREVMTREVPVEYGPDFPDAVVWSGGVYDRVLVTEQKTVCFQRTKVMMLVGGESVFPQPLGGHPDFCVRIGPEHDAKGLVETPVAPIYDGSLTIKTEPGDAQTGTCRTEEEARGVDRLSEPSDRLAAGERASLPAQAAAATAEACDPQRPDDAGVSDVAEEEYGDPGA